MITDQRDNERLKKEPEVRFIYSEPPLFFCNLDNDNGWISQQQQEKNRECWAEATAGIGHPDHLKI